MTDTPPDPRPSPGCQRWLDARRLDYAWLAARIGRSREYVRRLCLPFDDPERADPSGRMIRAIVVVTDGGVRPEDWHPPVAEILENARAAA